MVVDPGAASLVGLPVSVPVAAVPGAVAVEAGPLPLGALPLEELSLDELQATSATDRTTAEIAVRRVGRRGTRAAPTQVGGAVCLAERRAWRAEPAPVGRAGAPRYRRSVRLVIARCSVDYAGRLSAHLPPAIRLLMVKADGCVAIHADGGAYKPLNWMNAPNRLEESDDQWVVTSPKGETLTIHLEEVLSDSAWDLGVDPGLQKDGVEAHLQVLLAANCAEMEEGLTLVRREYPTDIGPVDLLCKDADGGTVAVEVKRRGEIDGVEQLARYLEFLNRDPMLRPVRGLFVAQQVKPQAKVLAATREIGWVEVDYDRLRGIESDELRLF